MHNLTEKETFRFMWFDEVEIATTNILHSTEKSLLSNPNQCCTEWF